MCLCISQNFVSWQVLVELEKFLTLKFSFQKSTDKFLRQYSSKENTVLTAVVEEGLTGSFDIELL